MWTRDSPGDPPSPDLDYAYQRECDRVDAANPPEPDDEFEDNEQSITHTCRICGASCDCYQPPRDCLHCEENWMDGP